MRASDRRSPRGADRRFQYVLADPKSQNRTCNRQVEKPGAMAGAGGRNFGRSYRARDNDWNNLRVASQRGRQTTSVVAAIHRDLLRADGPAGRTFRLLRRADAVGCAHDRDGAGVRRALRRGSIWNRGSMRRGGSGAGRVDAQGIGRGRSRSRRRGAAAMSSKLQRAHRERAAMKPRAVESVAGTTMKKVAGAMIVLGAIAFVSALLRGGAAIAWEAYLVNLLFFLGVAQGAVVASASFYLTQAKWGGSTPYRLGEAFAPFLWVGFFRRVLLEWIDRDGPHRGRAARSFGREQPVHESNRHARLWQDGLRFLGVLDISAVRAVHRYLVRRLAGRNFLYRST